MSFFSFLSNSSKKIIPINGENSGAEAARINTMEGSIMDEVFQILQNYKVKRQDRFSMTHMFRTERNVQISYLENFIKKLELSTPKAAHNSQPLPSVQGKTTRQLLGFYLFINKEPNDLNEEKLYQEVEKIEKEFKEHSGSSKLAKTITLLRELMLQKMVTHDSKNYQEALQQMIDASIKSLNIEEKLALAHYMQAIDKYVKYYKTTTYYKEEELKQNALFIMGIERNTKKDGHITALSVVDTVWALGEFTKVNQSRKLPSDSLDDAQRLFQQQVALIGPVLSKIHEKSKSFNKQITYSDGFVLEDQKLEDDITKISNFISDRTGYSLDITFGKDQNDYIEVAPGTAGKEAYAVIRINNIPQDKMQEANELFKGPWELLAGAGIIPFYANHAKQGLEFNEASQRDSSIFVRITDLGKFYTYLAAVCLSLDSPDTVFAKLPELKEMLNESPSGAPTQTLGGKRI